MGVDIKGVCFLSGVYSVLILMLMCACLCVCVCVQTCEVAIGLSGVLLILSPPGRLPIQRSGPGHRSLCGHTHTHTDTHTHTHTHIDKKKIVS